MNTELFISYRYLVAKRKERFISLISAISVLGVAIGVAALIVVISVMSGFDKDLCSKIAGNYSDVIVLKEGGIQNYPSLENKLKKSLKQITGISPFILSQILVSQDGRLLAVNLKGIEPRTEEQVSRIKEYLYSGSLEALKNQTVVIGRELSAYLGLGVGDDLEFFSAKSRVLQRLKIVGIFNSGMYEYDMSLVYTDLKTARDITGIPTVASGLAIKLKNLYLAPKLKTEIEHLLGFDYTVKPWSEINPNFFAALRLEKFTMFVILSLIVLVACFNIVSALIVMVTDKIKDIGILKAVGMAKKAIRKIFIWQGLLIGSLGIILGITGGSLICFLLKRYQFIRLPADIYYLDHLPVDWQLWPDITVILVAAVAIVLLATIYPANKAAGLNPAEALRYE
jgi:lipoprotein-releasing system permease protein